MIHSGLLPIRIATLSPLRDAERVQALGEGPHLIAQRRIGVALAASDQRLASPGNRAANSSSRRGMVRLVGIIGMRILADRYLEHFSDRVNQPAFRSSPRKRGPSSLAKHWMPAFAGMSGACVEVSGNRASPPQFTVAPDCRTTFAHNAISASRYFSNACGPPPSVA